MSPSHQSASASASPRELAPDILRGVALLGILLVNMQFFIGQGGYDLSRFNGAGDVVMQWLVLVFAERKFYLVFSLLFGYGLALQLERGGSSSDATVKKFRRRLWGLAIIGVAHLFLLFLGDILLHYVVLGAALLLVYRRSSHFLIRLAVGCEVVAVGLAGLVGLAILADPATVDISSDHTAVIPFADTVAEHVTRAIEVWFFLGLLQWPAAFGMFVFGLVAAREGWLRGQAQGPFATRSGLARLLVFGIAGGVISATAFLIDADLRFTGPGVAIALVLQTASAPALALGYAGLVVHGREWIERQPWSAWIARAGQMSLTNYLTHSVIAVALFSPWGFGLYPQVGPVAGLMIALGIWLPQLVFSTWWLNRYRNGPVEWLLRSFVARRWAARALKLGDQR